MKTKGDVRPTKVMWPIQHKMGTLPSAEQRQMGSNNLLYGIHHLREEFVWTGSAERLQLERVMRERCLLSAKDICFGLLE